MDGELMIALKWMAQAGYEIDRTHKIARRTPGKTKHQTYLEHVLSDNGWRIVNVGGGYIRKKDLKTSNQDKAKMMVKLAAIKANEIKRKREQMKADAWKRCLSSSPTKVVAYNLGWPWTERDEALYQYLRIVWR